MMTGITAIYLSSPPGSTPESLAAFKEIVYEWWVEFAEAYMEYGPGAADVTGLAGQWADMYRKVMKLQRGMWDREGFDYLKRESAREVLKDLIGHAFLSLEMMDRQGSLTSSSPAGSKSSTTNPEPGQRQSSGSSELSAH